MGVDSRRPPLPAPTEPSTLSSVDNDTTLRDDFLTDISTRTDKTSYSIPEDGTPVTINTAKKESGTHRKHPSQTSLLIEYFEGGKGDGRVKSRPSVRVRVTPSHRKSKSTNDHLQITQTNRNGRKPSYTRRISLGNKAPEEVLTTDPSYSEESNISSLPPVDIEVLQSASDLSSNGGRYIPVASDISSMPPDSMLGSQPVIRSPVRRRSRSLEREEAVETEMRDTLKAPTRQRSRSLSKERITQRVMEKLQQEKLQQKPVGSSSTKAKDTKTSREELTPSRKSHRRTSKSSRDEDLSAVSGTESSLLSSNAHRRSGDAHSVRSGVSGTSSINNPKLLATVEDAIKRLILPELNALKEEQRTQQNRSKYERMSRESAYETIPSTSSRDTSRRRVSKSSSAPHMAGSKPKVVLNRDGDDPGTVLSGSSSRRERRSSRGSASERSYAESTRDEEKVHRKKSRDKGHSARDAAIAGLAGAGLTAAALRHHDSRESKEDRKERRRRHSRSSRSRTASISESVEEENLLKEEVPPLPILQSELQGSELTRDSILSAETETRERPSSRSSRGTGTETPIREVSRGSRQVVSPAPRTPTRTPVALQRGLGTAHSNRSQGDLSLSTPRSDRSLSSRSREVSAAGLEAAAAAKARALESTEPQVSQYEIAETPTRHLSPVQSEASYREEATGSPRHLRSVHSGATMSSAGRMAQRNASNLSIQSLESSPSTKMARTRKRPQGVNLERPQEVLAEPETPKDVDEFFAENHEQNEMYRRELESYSQQGSPTVDYRHMTNYTDDSAEGQYLDREEKIDLGQDIRAVGSNPEYVHTPVAVESAVASLHEPSNISVRSSVSSPLKSSTMPPVSPGYEQHMAQETTLQEHPSKERWGAIRDQAQTLAESSRDAPAANSPRQSLSQSIDEPVKMHHSAFPTDDHMMPEIGFGMDDESEVTTNPSIIKGPLGGGGYHDQTDDLLSRQEERERTPSNSYEKAAVLGAGAGAAAAAIASRAAARAHEEDDLVAHEAQYHATVEDDYGQDYAGEPQYEQQRAYSQRDRTPSRSPALWKDEGYQSANQHGGITPEFRNRSTLFDDDGLGDFDDDAGDIFLNGKHSGHFSGNSHGMASPLYDAATGKGIDRIQSKDVVALMDHLTVRDAQRNARDTEILVTLVRSAAEMRNSFEEMKQFIRTQDAMIMNNTDKRVDIAEQRILGGPRPQPLGSPRVPRSSSEDIDNVDKKRKNVLKRALKGLSMKGDNDIKKIEQMLIQLLGEVEGLKQAHALTLAQNANRSNSLTSYENLRASGDPGYEPEGRAGTASSPNQSGYLSNPSSRRVQEMHSGYDVHQPHRISTVEEDDEEFAEHDGRYENTERMTTPTQEARRNNSIPSSIPQETPPQASRAFREPQSQDNTPKRKHKSNSSSIFGIPKISRWSRTTASTNPESAPRNSGSAEKRPFSDASRSGSQVNVAYYGDEQYELQDDDRLHSSPSLVRENAGSVRSPSPLIPEQEPAQTYVLDDPKYQAHRNSLNLQHPQPRPGPTGRHQNHLESQAQTFEPLHSPDYDQWGSNPSLARNRLSGGNASQGGGNLSPISSDGGYSQHSAAEQAAAVTRPPKVRDDGPLVPVQQVQQVPLAGHGQTRQMYSNPNEFGSQGALTPLAPIQEVRYSLETDTGHHYSPTPSPRPTGNQNLNPRTAMMSLQRKITGPRPMGSRSPSGQQGLSGQQPQFDNTGTVVRRKPVGERAEIESLESYRSSVESETF
ncbi:hypothetical protein K469DRAFT_684440 [Zopfia rhizophila CBS 207.26]|uniref:Uncharacterized protein n=1 Tax=Zopfia rhizophila CBS 207.26 TaxID=1314779 RepID=A0A6A6D6K9_9PEZI|nr:hypothetical protein K469DRAFT_684440 [Zopfia rhizophila CBS 207.26]